MRYIVSKKVLVVSPQSHQSESEDLVLEPTGPKKLVYKTYLRRTQAGPSRRVKEEQERISPNLIWAFFCLCTSKTNKCLFLGTEGQQQRFNPYFAINWNDPAKICVGCWSFFVGHRSFFLWQPMVIVSRCQLVLSHWLPSVLHANDLSRFWLGHISWTEVRGLSPWSKK